MELPNTPIDFPDFNRDHPAANTPLGLPRPSEVVGPVFFDTETSGLHQDDGSRVSVVSVAYQVEGDPVPRSAAWPFGQGPEGESLDLGRRAWNHLVRWLASAGGGLVGHNIRFDINQMGGHSVAGYPGRDLIDRVLFDTMVAAAEVWPRGPLALKKIATRLYGHDADEEQKALKPYLGPKTNPRFDRVPWEVMFPYAIRDAELTYAVFYEQQAWLQESHPTGRFLAQEMEIVRCLLRMEQAGLPYDPKASLEFADQLRGTMETIQSRVPYDIRPKMLKQYYFGHGSADLGRGQEVECLGLEPYSTTDSGQPQLTAAVVEKMVKNEVPFSRDLQEYNRLKSAISKWYEPFAQRAGADNRIRTSFRHTGGTKSGRFSATRLNLQAVPKDYALRLPVPTPRAVVAQAVRDLPAPKDADHWELWDLDLEQAELRLAALDAGCEPMLEQIREGEDLHGSTAAQLFGVTPEDSDWDMYRSISKRANFAQPLDEPISTPTGPKPMGDIQVGDFVTGSDGKPTRVKSIPFEGDCEVYQVSTKSRYDAVTTRCSPDHLWLVQNYDTRSKFRVMRTADIAESSSRWFIPSCPVIEQKPVDLPVDPYILGVLLGDGSYRTAPYFRILTSDSAIAEEVERRLPESDKMVRTVYPDRPNMTRYSIHGGGVMQGLRELGLVNGYKNPVTGADKFVPDQYLVGSVQQRLDLLRGLMDSDGFASKGGYQYENNTHGTVGTTVKFCNTAPRLIESVGRIVQSLGGRCSTWWKSPQNDRCKPSATVSISIPFAPFHLQRKADRWTPPAHNSRVEIVVTQTGRVTRQRCIEVEAEDHLYVTGSGLVTHNSLQFGAGPRTFQTMLANQAGVELPFNEVRKIVYDWRDLYPEFGRAIERNMDFAERHAYVEMTTGRPRYYAPGEDRHSAFNQRIQGSLAEFGKRWLISTDRLLKPYRQLGIDAGIGYSGLLLVVHDSQVVLLPDTVAKPLVDQICDNARALWGEMFPGVPGGADSERWA